ncbi:MAG: DUF4097 family beta strand repeat-containing protein [Breznakibacter sp.]
MKKLACVLFALMAVLLANAQQQVKKSFSDVTSIDVNGIFCQVSVESVAGESVEFDGKVLSSPQSDDIKILYQQTGTDLKVWIETPKRWNSTMTGSLTFKVPRTTNVKVDNVSGNVSVKGLAGGSVVLKSVSGNVQSSSISSNLKAETVSGNLLVTTVDGNLNASSVSGNVEVTQVSGMLNASTVSGRLMVKKVQGQTNASSVSGSLEVTDVNSDLNVKTTSGAIVVGNVKGDVDCQSTSGQIKLSGIDGSIKAKNVSGDINGLNVMLAGQSSFNTMSGSVNIALLNPADAVSFDLKSFSGKLNALGIIGKERLSVQKGNVKVYGETFSGNQAYQ